MAQRPALLTEHLDIIVVDDNVDAADMLGILLESSGATVRVVYGGSAAIAAATERVPDLMFVDLSMPMVSGYDVARTLRGDATFARSVLVAVSGYGTDRDVLRCKEVGFDLHLVKPVEPQRVFELLATVSTKRLEEA